MPTYQYACTNPEERHRFEVVQSFTDAPVAECPDCGSPVRKVYGSVGVVFKGSGFYRTDSRKAPAKEGAASSSGGSDGSSSNGVSTSTSNGSSSKASASGGSSSGGSSSGGSSSSTSSSGGGSKAAG